MSRMNGDIMKARAVLLLLTTVQGLLVWYLSFVPYPIKNALIRLGTALTLLVGWFVIWIVQLFQYQSMTGIRVVERDHFFMGVMFSQMIVCMAILVSVALVWRRKEKNEAEANEGSCGTQK